MSRFASTGIAFFVFTIMVGALYAVFVYVPTERQMGLVQRIFYFHVSSAICSLVAFALVFIGSIQYLRRREERWDRLAVASAELGVVFALIVLITGPLWARPVWGVFWRWEPRLTFMLITFMMYVAYLMVRAYAGGSVEQTRRFAAVLGIVAFVNVPLVHFSVNLWSADQQLHPQKVELAPKMVVGRYVSLIAIGSLFLFLLKRRMQLEQATQTLNRIRQKLDDDDDGR